VIIDVANEYGKYIGKRSMYFFIATLKATLLWIIDVANETWKRWGGEMKKKKTKQNKTKQN
jgi:hypothetical protein